MPNTIGNKISDGQLGSPVTVTSYNQVCLMFNCHSTKHICILVWILQYTSQIPQLLHVYLLCELISFMFLKWLQLGFFAKGPPLSVCPHVSTQKNYPKLDRHREKAFPKYCTTLSALLCLPFRSAPPNSQHKNKDFQQTVLTYLWAHF